MQHYIQRSINGEKVKRYIIDNNHEKPLDLWEGSHYFFIDESYLHYAKIFDETDLAALREKLENQVHNLLDCKSTIPHNSIHYKQIVTIFKNFFSFVINDERFFSHQKQSLLTNGLQNDINELNSYIETLSKIFFDLISMDLSVDEVPSIQKYFPYFMSCYLFNNSYSDINACCNEFDNQFNAADFSLAKIKNNTKKKHWFIKRLMHYSPGGNFSYLEAYQTLCDKYYIKNLIDEDAFCSFWYRNYYLIYIFSICVECCIAADLKNCDYGTSFVLFLNQIYSKDKTISFREFITFLAVFFFGALISSKERNNYKTTSNIVQEICYDSVEKIFANLLYKPTPFQLNKKDFSTYIYTMLVNYSTETIPEKTFSLIPPELDESLRLEAAYLFKRWIVPQYDIYRYYTLSKRHCIRNTGKVKKYRKKLLHVALQEYSDKLKILSEQIEKSNISFDSGTKLYPTGFSGSTHIQNTFVSYFADPFCQLPPQGKFYLEDDALVKVYQDIVKISWFDED